MSTLYLIGASRRRLHPSETCRDAAEKANAPIPRRVFPRQRGTGARGRRSSLFREHLTAVSLASGGLNACQTSALRTHRSVKGARMACKPDSVTESPPPMTIPLGAGLPPRSGCQPGSRTKAARAGSLFGIAPGGACRAGPVARPAVGSYPTVSPLLRRTGAVCSLWRFPSGCPGRALPGTVALWSPDFPHPERCGHPALRARLS